MNSRAKTIFFALAVLILVAANCLVWIDPWHPLNRNGWLYMSYCIAASTCYYLLPLALLGHYSRWFYRLTLPPLLLLDLVLVFVHLNFGFQLDGCWIGIVLASDPQETMLFLREYRFSLVAILLAYPLAIYLLLKLLARIPEPQTWKGTWLCRSAAIVFLATQIVLPISYTRNCALYLVVDSFRTYHLHRQLTNLRTHPQLPNLTLVSPASASPLGILVIGESATSSHLNLYGYPRDTTPCLSSLAADLIVCTNATAASFNTAEALTYLLTTATRENPSDLRYTLPQALAQAGYAVHLLSNQRHWGRNDNTTQYVFAGCNTQTYIAETKPEGTRTYDLELLPHVTSHFQSSTSSLFLILHLQGSHEPCAIYYPPSESFFEVPPITTGLTTAIARDPVMRRNHYDNSIRYTDQLLGELINLLAATPRPAYMIYLSDYGESPDSPTWRDVSNPTTWEVPLVIYLNPEYQSAYPQIAASIRKSAAQPQSLDHLLAIILQSAALLPNPPSAANSHSTPASTATNPPSPTSSPS